MLTRVAQRYVIAVGAFLIAVVFTGIGLTSAVECLAVFSVVYVVAAAVQARRSPYTGGLAVGHRCVTRTTTAASGRSRPSSYGCAVSRATPGARPAARRPLSEPCFR